MRLHRGCPVAVWGAQPHGCRWKQRKYETRAGCCVLSAHHLVCACMPLEKSPATRAGGRVSDSVVMLGSSNRWVPMPAMCVARTKHAAGWLEGEKSATRPLHFRVTCPRVSQMDASWWLVGCRRVACS